MFLKTVRVLAAAAATLLLFPVFSYAADPFGGRATIVKACYNETIYALLSPPRGGPFVWTTATKTYQFGPPRAVGQWLLGLSGPPYYCLWSVAPITPIPAKTIIMMGSSGPSSPAVGARETSPVNIQFPGSLLTTPPPPDTTTNGSASPTPSTP